MKKNLARSLWLIAALSILLSACGLSLAADVTPPPGFSPTEAAQPVASETVFPLVPPNPANGKLIYAEKCTPCHGETGMGDGPMAPQLPNPAPAFGSAEVARSANPVEWFSMVTNGNLEKLMPGFSGSLNDRERWDVVAYALSMSVTPEVLAEGQSIYTEKCQSCHGDKGSDTIPNWKSNPALLASTSNQQIYDLVSAGKAPSMPGFSNELSSDQIWAVTSLVRAQTFSDAPAEVQATPEPTSGAEGTPVEGTPAVGTPAAVQEGKTNISGKVENISGGSIPANLEVTLTGYDSMTPAVTLKQPVAADGTFKFTDVDVVSGRVFMATVDYQGITFNSDVVHPDQLQPGQDVTDMAIQFYDTTTDTSNLTADRMHIFFEPVDDKTVQVVELLILNNKGNQAIVPAGSDQPVIKVELPANAANLKFQDGVLGQDYLQTDTGFGDMHTVLPGTGAQLMFAYELPLEKKTLITLNVPLPVDAAIAMVPTSTFTIQSKQLTDSGERAIQDMTLRIYTGNTLSAGSKLDLTLIKATPSLFSSNTTTGIIIGATGFGLVLILAGVWLMRQRRNAAETETEEQEVDVEDNQDSLLDAIVALDDQYRSGELPEEAYQQRRAELKERLIRLQSEG